MKAPIYHTFGRTTLTAKRTCNGSLELVFEWYDEEGELQSTYVVVDVSEAKDFLSRVSALLD